MYSTSCANTHHDADATTFRGDGMVLNIKKSIYQEGNITFLRNEKILRLCLKDYVF